MKLYRVTYDVECKGMAEHRDTGALTMCTWLECFTAIVRAENAARAVVIQAQFLESKGTRATMKSVAPLSNHV
jgi:hypothetical protein